MIKPGQPPVYNGGENGGTVGPDRTVTGLKSMAVIVWAKIGAACISVKPAGRDVVCPACPSGIRRHKDETPCRLSVPTSGPVLLLDVTKS